MIFSTTLEMKDTLAIGQKLPDMAVIADRPQVVDGMSEEESQRCSIGWFGP